MLNTTIQGHDLEEAKQHIIIALGEMDPKPKDHEELIEKMRGYFEDQRVSVFSRFLNAAGEDDFREFIAETVIESGLYEGDDLDKLRPKKRT